MLGTLLGKAIDKQKSMTISLEAARTAAQQKRWHLILGLKPGALAEEIRKAKRRLQLTAHTDKGGTKELSQLINHAADELLQRCPKDWIPQASEDDPEWWDQLLREAKEELERRQRMEEERAQRAARLREERRREEEQKKQRADEERRRRYEESERRWLQRQRIQRDRAHEDTVRLVGHRRTRCKSQAYLGKLAGKAFPMVQYRLRRLQEAGKHQRAAALAYAVEAEMCARRVARENRFPKTEGLTKRDACKAARLDQLRPAYQKAYDRMRYVHRTGKPQDFARLCVQRLLNQAWGILLEIPAPLDRGDAIVMADWQGFSL